METICVHPFVTLSASEIRVHEFHKRRPCDSHTLLTPKLAPVRETGTPVTTVRLPMDKPPRKQPQPHTTTIFLRYVCTCTETTAASGAVDALRLLSVSAPYDKHFLGEVSLIRHTWYFPSTAIYDHAIHITGINASCSEPIQI